MTLWENGQSVEMAKILEKSEEKLEVEKISGVFRDGPRKRLQMFLRLFLLLLLLLHPEKAFGSNKNLKKKKKFIPN